MAHLNPKPEDVAPKVPDLRRRFEEKYAANIAQGAYDARDLDRLREDDAYARAFLRTMGAKDDVEKATGVIDECFRFRKGIEIWDLTDASFSPENLEKAQKGCYYKGASIEGHLILYIDVKGNSASVEDLPELKRYIAYKFEEHHRHHPETMCVVLMDMYGASSSNVRMDLTRYIMQCFATYFPAYLAYMLIYEMPFLLSATWKVMSAFLSTEQKLKLRQVNKKTIRSNIEEEHLWDHMK